MVPPQSHGFGVRIGEDGTPEEIPKMGIYRCDRCKDRVFSAQVEILSTNCTQAQCPGKYVKENLKMKALEKGLAKVIADTLAEAEEAGAESAVESIPTGQAGNQAEGESLPH